MTYLAGHHTPGALLCMQGDPGTITGRPRV